VQLWTTVDGTARRGISGQDLDRWASRRDLFDGLVPFLANSRRDAVPGITAAFVEARVLSLLGTQPSVGRLPLPADGEPGATPVAVISHGLWTSQFAGRREAIGERVRAEGDEYEVIGVMPRGFFFPDQDVQIWSVLHPRETRGYETAGLPLFHAVARLAPGVSAESAARSLGKLQRRDRENWRPVVLPIQRLTIDRYQTALLTLQAALGSLLLIVCISVGTLVAARADSRRPELHTRVFLGATSGRLFRQLLSEGAVIAVLVAVVAVPIAEIGLHGLLWLDPSGVFRVSGAGLGLPALAFLLGIAILALMATHTTGALLARPALMIQSLRASTPIPGWHRWLSVWNVATVFQVAHSVTVLTGSVLLIRSFVEISRVKWGFDPESVLVVDTKLPPRMHRKQAVQNDFADQVLARLRASGVVRSAAVAYGVPIRWGGWASTSVAVDGELRTTDWSVRRWVVGPGYFRTLRTTVVAGRELADSDDLNGRPVAVINESLAARLWPGESAVGKRLTIMRYRRGPDGKLAPAIAARLSARDPHVDSDPSAFEPMEPAAREVVGVVGDIRMFGLDAAQAPSMYVSYRQPVLPVMYDAGVYTKFVVRTEGRPEGVAAFARHSVEAVAGDLDVLDVVSLSSLVSQSVAGVGNSRLLQLVSFWFSAAAFVLAGTGVYAVSWYTISRRRKELAVRMALGAHPGRIQTDCALRGLSLVLSGLVIGAAAAYGLTRFLKAFLYEVSPTDPLTFFGSAVVIGMVAVVAYVVPVRLIDGIDAAEILRE
jgi:predicted permease